MMMLDGEALAAAALRGRGTHSQVVLVSPIWAAVSPHVEPLLRRSGRRAPGPAAPLVAYYLLSVVTAVLLLLLLRGGCRANGWGLLGVVSSRRSCAVGRPPHGCSEGHGGGKWGGAGSAPRSGDRATDGSLCPSRVGSLPAHWTVRRTNTETDNSFLNLNP
jgi:hypothetical protein